MNQGKSFGAPKERCLRPAGWLHAPAGWLHVLQVPNLTHPSNTRHWWWWTCPLTFEALRKISLTLLGRKLQEVTYAMMQICMQE